MTFIQADATHLPFADDTFDLVFTSPPYTDARTYGIGAQRKCKAWVEWMLAVVAECVRVTRGLVIVNCAGVTRDWCYQPGPEGLLYEWWKSGGRCWRPAYWNRVGIPGSGGKQWLRADIEYVLAFTKCDGAIPFADNTANGHPPKWAPGGEMSHRLSDGARVNQWGHSIESGASGGNLEVGRSTGKRPSHAECTPKRPPGSVSRKAISRVAGKSRADGQDEVQDYEPPVLANPGCLVKGIKVGGGLMGHKLAHENEAPFPLKLAQWFIRGWCPPSGIVLDPFSGSGTTVHAALSLGRRAIGCDLRFSQCDLGRRRCGDVQAELF